MTGWRRFVAALVAGGAWTAALWVATGPGVRVPEALRTVFGWLLFPGWMVAWDSYQLALVADAILYALVAWLLLTLARRLRRRQAAAR